MQKIRRNMLFVPGNSPSLFKDIIAFKPDTVMFDLEDSIDVNEKDAARQLTKRMLNFFNYNQYNIETAVRINHFSTEFYQADLKTMVQETAVNIIRLPKVESKSDVEKVVTDIEILEQQLPKKRQVMLFCAIESAKGVLNAYEIAAASDRVQGIALGGVDYLLDLNATKTNDRKEILFARQMILHAARAAKIDAFDCVYTNANDVEGLRKEAQFAKELGFNGKSAIHPRQIAIINEVFSPTAAEIAEALKIAHAYTEFASQKKGVFVIDGQMVDKPVIARAKRILEIANIKNTIKEE